MQRIYLSLIIVICILLNPIFTYGFTSHFASIKSSEVNVRKGPSTRYRIEWVYKSKGEPVEVIGEFEHWKKIRDFNGDEGWIKSIMLSKKRSAIITIPLPKNTKQTNEMKLFASLYKKPDNNSYIFAKIESSKRVAIEECKKEWCKIKVSNSLVGWIRKQYLWGVYSNEIFK